MNLFEYVYYLGLSAKKYYSFKNQKRLPHKVISIGNITVGGTGKTPATIAVAGEAKRRGFMPVILTRGYKGSIKGPAFVQKSKVRSQKSEEKSDTEHITLLFGDEPVLLAEKLKDIPVVKCADRYTGGMFAIENLNLQPSTLSPRTLFILDDGFQHWRLHRDKDIVLIDVGNPFGNKKLLPSGRLREPLKSLERADIIVLSKHPKSPDINKQVFNEIRKYNPDSPIFFAEHKPVSCRLLSGERRSLSLVSGKKLFGFCAIANPKSFMETIRSAGAELAGFESYRDHYKYKSSDILQVKAGAEKCGADWIVTTEKDIIKTKHLDLPENILIIEIEFLAENDFLNAVFDI
jgi:tetraacyldisaccharide 4'-kinase